MIPGRKQVNIEPTSFKKFFIRAPELIVSINAGDFIFIIIYIMANLSKTFKTKEEICFWLEKHKLDLKDQAGIL